MAVVRSPYAHARISSIDTAAAKAADGVVAVFTGADLRDDWTAAMPCAWPVTEDMKSPKHFPLAVDRCTTRATASRSWSPTRARTRSTRPSSSKSTTSRSRRSSTSRRPRQDGATLVHEELGTNVSYVWKLETGTFDDGADVVVKHSYYQPPLIPNAIEPRGVVARPEPGGDVTLWSATQIPHILRLLTAATLGISETKLRVIAPDVGGGFGSKLDVYAEELLAVALARRLGSPIKWVEERSENAMATIHGRDFVTTLELAATKDGQDHRDPGGREGVDGRVPAARDARDPAPRSVDLRRPVRDPELQRHVHGRVHEHDADRRLPRRRPARGDVRARADDGPAREGARHRPGRAAAPELHQRSSRPRSPPA